MQKANLRSGLSSCLIKTFFVLACIFPVGLPGAANSTTPDEAYSMLCDRTVFFYEDLHGNQIEYFSPDGRAQLWYPGNWRVNSGRWEIRPSERAPNKADLCFLYGKKSYNPITKEWGGSWRCRSFSLYYQREVEKRSIVGDIFNLSNNTVPMVLPSKPKINLEPFRSSATYDIPPLSLSPACAAQTPTS